MTVDLDIVPVPADESPASDFEYACQTCGKELFYSGKGRHPKFCDEHKRGAKTASTGTRRATGKGNDALAQQAADVLSQVNGMVALGMMWAPGPLRMPRAAAEITERDESFNAVVRKALSADPKLSRMIARGGSVSGAAGLIIAYGMLAGAVYPVAMEEIGENRAAANVRRTANA